MGIVVVSLTCTFTALLGFYLSVKVGDPSSNIFLIFIQQTLYMNHLYFGDCLDVLKEYNQQPLIKADNQIFKNTLGKETKESNFGFFD